jgi:hypothetical protein
LVVGAPAYTDNILLRRPRVILMFLPLCPLSGVGFPDATSPFIHPVEAVIKAGVNVEIRVLFVTLLFILK